MKKNLIFIIIAIVLAVATIFVGSLLILKNIGNSVISIGNAKGLVGDVVEVPITIEKNPGIWGGQIIIDYDSKYFSFDSFLNGSVFEQCQVNDTGDSVAILVTHTVTNSGLKDSKINGTVATLKFRIKATSQKGKQELKFNTETNFCNENQDVIELTQKNGTITVK